MMVNSQNVAQHNCRYLEEHDQYFNISIYDANSSVR